MGVSRKQGCHGKERSDGSCVHSLFSRELVFRRVCTARRCAPPKLPTNSLHSVESCSHGMEDPARVSVIRARRPHMQVNVDEEEEEDDEDEKEEGREEKVECPICGEVTSDQLHYGGLACPSCKAFFRRTVAIHRWSR